MCWTCVSTKRLPMLCKYFLWALYQVDVWDKSIWFSTIFTPQIMFLVETLCGQVNGCLHFFMYSKYVLRTCTDRLYVQAWNLLGRKLQKIYSQGMSRFTASVLDHRVGCWPFQGRDISKTQRMNIFLEAGRLPLRSIMTTGTKWGGVLVLWKNAGFHRIPHHKWHRRTQHRSKFLWFLSAGGRFFYN